MIDLLGRTGAARASELLREAVQKPIVATKIAALDALGALGPTLADESMLGLIGDHAPEVRLHAAEALASAGGVAARDALLGKLAGGTEIDRVAALTALGGILVRAPVDRAWTELRSRTRLAAGGERDAILLVLGRAAPVRPVVERLVRLDDPDDRRTLATACAGRPDARTLLQGLLADSDPSVRAEAAWSLGSVGEPDAVAGGLGRLTDAREAEAPEVAVNATGALARIAGRTHDGQATAALCELRPRPAPAGPGERGLRSRARRRPLRGRGRRAGVAPGPVGQRACRGGQGTRPDTSDRRGEGRARALRRQRPVRRGRVGLPARGTTSVGPAARDPRLRRVAPRRRPAPPHHLPRRARRRAAARRDDRPPRGVLRPRRAGRALAAAHRRRASQGCPHPACLARRAAVGPAPAPPSSTPPAPPTTPPTGPCRVVVAAAPSYLKRRGVPQKPPDLLQHDCICMRWATSGEPWAWELERGTKRGVCRCEGR